MGKLKETYSSAYYGSKEEFLNDVEAGAIQSNGHPQYVGLLEIVRFLKLLNKDKTKAIQQKSKNDKSERFSEQQLCFAAQA